MASRIEDYGIVANGRTVALISKQGSVDWMCMPNFDSDASFSSLLGYDEHGRWVIRPTVAIKSVRQEYEENSMILVTEFTTEGGKARIVDFMPITDDLHDLVRIVEGVEGDVPMEVLLTPRFHYGADRPRVVIEGGTVTMTAGPDSMVLRGGEFERTPQGLSCSVTVRAGESVKFDLAWFPSHKKAPAPIDINFERQAASNFWVDWAKRFPYQGKYRDAVLRSLMTLKALTYAPTGAIVAAPTAALPEELGGVRNWDYRFCWVRDASLTLHALMFGGYVEEASAFGAWINRAVAGDPAEAQIMYDIHGGRRLTEFELKWLPGYEGSRPVHVGNAAYDQLQLDIYGEAVSALYLGRKMGLPEARDSWTNCKTLVGHVEKIWQQPDDGIWEVRGGRKHFTYSKVMAWVAVDRIVRLIEEYRLGEGEGEHMLPHLRALREQMHGEICDRGFNTKLNAFTQYYGGEALDASVLLMTHVGFLPPHDPRIEGTVAAIERDLMEDGLVLRYSTAHGVDGLAGSEGAFLACSFWLADNYAFSGRTKEAEELFDRLLSLRNHLGLLAEEWDTRNHRQIGNFPQGFSHLALITTVRALEGPPAGSGRA